MNEWSKSARRPTSRTGEDEGRRIVCVGECERGSGESRADPIYQRDTNKPMRRNTRECREEPVRRTFSLKTQRSYKITPNTFGPLFACATKTENGFRIAQNRSVLEQLYGMPHSLCGLMQHESDSSTPASSFFKSGQKTAAPPHAASTCSQAPYAWETEGRD